MWKKKINLNLNSDSFGEFSASYLRYLTTLSKKIYPVHQHEQHHVGEKLFGEIQM